MSEETSKALHTLTLSASGIYPDEETVEVIQTEFNKAVLAIRAKGLKIEAVVRHSSSITAAKKL